MRSLSILEYGYQEIFTDPSYHSKCLLWLQLILKLRGTYEEVESDSVKVAGIVVEISQLLLVELEGRYSSR